MEMATNYCFWLALLMQLQPLDDPFALLAPDPGHSTRIEIRQWLIGESDVGVLVVVFTVREAGNVYRVISARRANRSERKQYDERKKLPI